MSRRKSRRRVANKSTFERQTPPVTVETSDSTMLSSTLEQDKIQQYEEQIKALETQISLQGDSLSTDYEETVQQYKEKINSLEVQLQKLDINYKGMAEREKRYLHNIQKLKKQLKDASASTELNQQLAKAQTNYEGMLAREERYLREINALKSKVASQKNELYRTYSYRLGYLLIHSTKSFANFIRLPKELRKLYVDNKNRKKKRLVSDAELMIDAPLTQASKVLKAPANHRTVADSVASGDKLKIATIMDEFTSFCFAPEAETLQISPDAFKEELAEFKPDFVFIESAWQGKDGLWKLKISQQAEELFALIDYCREHQIKTLFWNKEDPVHFGTFIEVAKMVDVVFTTDIDCIKKYKEVLQHDEVYLLPFAAQPKTHNPIELFERQDKFNFAGSYYLKYPVRQRDFAVLSEVAINSKGLDIYDRNFNNDHPHYQFPSRYSSFILGSLPPEEIDKAYKGYEFGINMNTIKQSQTMFARRVFEMLASNTVVLSNYSRGVRLLFGDLVICSDSSDELQRQLDAVLTSDLQRKKFKLQGLRSVLSQHTYEQRLKYILDKLKISNASAFSKEHILVIAKGDTSEDIKQIVESFNNQANSNKTLLLLTTQEIQSAANIICCKDIEALESAIAEIEFSHITFFKASDYYGKYYLDDMVQSYSYLKHYDYVPVTKDSYYAYDGGLVEQRGTEYQFVEEFVVARTLYTKEYFLELINSIKISELLEHGVVQAKAFSIDCLNYIEHGASADVESVSTLCDDFAVDAGVSLESHLLPIAESIQFEKPAKPVDKVISFDKALIESTLRKEISFIEDQDGISFDSKLKPELHRLITLTQPFEIAEWNRIQLKLEASYQGDVLFVFEFLNKEFNQLSHVSVSPKELIMLAIPEDSVYGRLCVRVKGKSNVSIRNTINITLEKVVETVLNQTYDSSDIVTFTKDDIDAQLIRPKSKQIVIKNQSHGVEISSTLAEDKHAYIYFREIFKREDVNLLMNTVFETVGQVVDCDFRTVFLFLDKNKEKLAHSIIKVDNFSHAMAIPEECVYIRIGFKITGSGKADIQTIKIGELRDRVNNLVGKSDTLVLAKQYPAYDDLYKYGFLHTRLKAYKHEGVLTDMFKFSNNESNYGFSEFESIDVFEGSAESLREALSSGQFKKVLVHLIDHHIWNVLRDFSKDIEIYIWVHGAEIQTWQRREFEFELMDKAQIERQKRLSDQRRRFWQKMLDNDLNSNIHFIFVSQYFLEESEEGLDRKFPEKQVSIIHNYIDNNSFPYHPKPIEQRYKLLSIRPYASRKYANDMTVNAILEMSKSPDFNKFEIALYGDGELFDELVEPLRKFNNISLHKQFLSHAQISALHKQYGVFLTPTRMDSQGVSRDEAMSSGLVPVTTAVTAIPEFVDEECSILVAGEDYESMAVGVLLLANRPDEFLKLSEAASKRVRKQCGYENTLKKELGLFIRKAV